MNEPIPLDYIGKNADYILAVKNPSVACYPRGDEAFYLDSYLLQLHGKYPVDKVLIKEREYILRGSVLTSYANNFPVNNHDSKWLIQHILNQSLSADDWQPFIIFPEKGRTKNGKLILPLPTARLYLSVTNRLNPDAEKYPTNQGILHGIAHLHSKGYVSNVLYDNHLFVVPTEKFILELTELN